MIAPVYACAAAATGVAQAYWLGRAARGGPSALGLLLRLGSAGAVLVLAARDGQLLTAAGAWLISFLLAALWIYRSLR